MTGQQAFPNSLIPAITQKLRAAEGLKPPPGLKISRELENLIRKCTRPEPAERPTAEQALAEVRRLAQPRPNQKAVSRAAHCPPPAAHSAGASSP
jgi:serine/threonine protein kinase